MEPSGTNQSNKKGLLNIMAFKMSNESKNIYCQMAKRFSELIIQEEKREVENLMNQKKEIRIKSDTHSKLNEKLESSFYDEKNDDVNSMKFESLPYGRMDSKMKKSASTNYFYRDKQLEKCRKNRTTLKEEIEISQQFQQKIPKYFTRKNFDLMRIVEDQVYYYKIETLLFLNNQFFITIFLFLKYRKEEKEKFEKSIENS